ncbi:15300_t:CDS:2, partial [Entrophospora sp. SA101]
HVDHNNNNNSQIQMGKKKELTAEQYGAILYGHKQGDSYQKIPDNVQCGKTTVHDAIKHFKKMGQTYVKVLQKHAIPSLYKLVPRNQGIFQEDNAPPHRSKIAADV